MSDSARSAAQSPAVQSTAVFATLTTATLMLFSMFFGAGNLIFPPILGAQAGTHFVPAILGFLAAGVALPVVSMIAVVLSGEDVLDLSRQAGRFFGVVFPVLIYLSIGAFYAVPRTAVVSYSTAFSPVFGVDSQASTVAFCAVYFLVVWLMCYRETGLIDRIGKWLTPVLLVLLALMVLMALRQLEPTGAAAAEKFAEHPGPTGLIEGYLTMDSVAALAFGIVVISALREKGIGAGGGMGLRRAAIIAAIGAGALLGAVYIALGLVGRVVPHPEQYEDGAAILTDIAYATMGQPGRVLFGSVVLLACIGTAAGLIGSTSGFFHRLLPAVSYQQWVLVFTLVSFAVSTVGLQSVLAIAGPIIGFLYPPAITLVAITLLAPLWQRRLYYTFRLGVWGAVVWSLLASLSSVGVASARIESLIGWSPMHEQQLGWLLPVIGLIVVGLILDHAPATRKTPAAA
ncbi:Branched-chain amino acid transport system 2 carrier protein [Corynebacterium ciconiae DSM 44920]|uniref:branched-chain amino acid transport system II carrier protein n=1 Tax=Corynebacterium ciconiae TaxID=227319 RepID=UPI0003640286|nr:branched-chain amino acid transport system II carrier protein [Corynebacterium ciconiae]WKD60650.1 Branched-chain amino acid transport system 2 carrier protein [Corynebacterium ciconiae DSM 44920]